MKLGLQLKPDLSAACCGSLGIAWDCQNFLRTKVCNFNQQRLLHGEAARCPLVKVFSAYILACSYVLFQVHKN